MWVIPQQVYDQAKARGAVLPSELHASVAITSTGGLVQFKNGDVLVLRWGDSKAPYWALKIIAHPEGGTAQPPIGELEELDLEAAVARGAEMSANPPPKKRRRTSTRAAPGENHQENDDMPQPIDIAQLLEDRDAHWQHKLDKLSAELTTLRTNFEEFANQVRLQALQDKYKK